MSKLNKTVIDLANEMYDNFTLSKREDGSGYWHLNKRISWQTNICMKAHGERLANDETYDVIVEALGLMSECEDEEEIEERTFEIEGAVYTSDLTEWLNSDNRNVYYLTQVMEEFDIKDGFQLLLIAHSEFKRDIAINVLEGLKKRIEEIKQ